jgi:hypothetical protein
MPILEQEFPDNVHFQHDRARPCGSKEVVDLWNCSSLQGWIDAGASFARLRST